MKTLVVTTAALVTLSAQAALVHMHWVVPPGKGEFLFTVDTQTGLLSWERSNLWVSTDAGSNAAIWGPPTVIGGQVLPGPQLLPTYFSWPDGTSTFWQYLQYSADSGRYQMPGSGPVTPTSLAPQQAADFLSNSVGFTVDPGRDDVLDGPIFHAPEPGTYALLAGLGLLGLAACRRLIPAA